MEGGSERWDGRGKESAGEQRDRERARERESLRVRVRARETA